MKTCIDTRTLVAIAAFALAGCAADDTSAASAQQPCAGQAPTQTIFLEDAQGHSFRLAHFSQCGWKYLPGREEGRLSFSPVAASQADTPDGNPLSVFVDGPTGYTFAYIPDAGWKFIGQIKNESP